MEFLRNDESLTPPEGERLTPLADAEAVVEAHRDELFGVTIPLAERRIANTDIPLVTLEDVVGGDDAMTVTFGPEEG